MATFTGREHRPQSRMDRTREILARRRRNLLFPILLLVAVSLMAVSALLYWSAESASERDAEAQDDLIRSVMQIRKDGLRQLVIDYARWGATVSRQGMQLDARWAREELPAYLQAAFAVAAGWVVAPDGTVRFSFENGQVVAPERSPVLPAGAAQLVAAARAGRSIDEVPASGFVLYQQDLALVGASLVAPLDNAEAPGTEQGNVLVFLQPVDLTLFTRAGVGHHIDNLHFLRGKAPPGFLGCEVKGLDGQVIGSIVWRDQRSGDDLLWSLAPLLLVALLAVCFLLVLAIKRVEMVISREGRLSISLYQEKQRRSQKSDFVSMVSHELRTPLQAIGTSADMLERFGDQMSESERHEETKTIRRAVGTLARLVDDVLVMGRAEAGENGDGGEPRDLGRFCRAVWREVSVALRSKQRMVLQDEIGTPIYGLNDAAMHTILSNLMQNAIKYSRGIGDVAVELRRDGGSYLVIVTDCGPGVPAAERDAIFQPYWRSKQVDGIAGTGLGLPVARSAARSMGGDLKVERSEDGRGARFVVRWPVPD
ncbi:MAG: ATP-binding protein [Kiloniellaceae bacterium]